MRIGYCHKKAAILTDLASLRQIFQGHNEYIANKFICQWEKPCPKVKKPRKIHPKMP
jgi:hypothetical protein